MLRIGSLYEAPLSGLELEFCGIGHKLDVIQTRAHHGSKNMDEVPMKFLHEVFT